MKTAELGRAGAALKASKARSLVLKYARQHADAKSFGEDAPHGVPSTWGAVKAADCKRQKGNVVACAYGRFWADGHECFNLRQVTPSSRSVTAS